MKLKMDGICKSFGSNEVLKSVGFQLSEGEICALLGENGAGKSTTISIMCGLLEKDGGSISICGTDTEKNMQSLKRRIGVVFQNSALDQALSVRDNLSVRAALYGIRGKEFARRLDELAELLDFGGLLGRTVGKLSGGQRRRIDIARALLNRPEILILDEPTTGLDPQTRSLLWNVVSDLRKRENLTVFLTTHYMEEAADADYVIILDSGRIAAEGTPLALKNAYAGDFITLYGLTESEIQSLKLPCEALPGGWRVAVRDTAAATELILRRPELFRDYEITKGRMDDVFLAVTGRTLTGGAEK